MRIVSLLFPDIRGKPKLELPHNIGASLQPTENKQLPAPHSSIGCPSNFPYLYHSFRWLRYIEGSKGVRIVHVAASRGHRSIRRGWA